VARERYTAGAIGFSGAELASQNIPAGPRNRIQSHQAGVVRGISLGTRATTRRP
jgi:hypothetical protein